MTSFEAPGLLALNDDYQTVRFRGSFGLPSPYKGPVTPEVDAKWREIEDSEWMVNVLAEALLSI